MKQIGAITKSNVDSFEPELPNPLEVHKATSRWQTCNCRTCQEKRMKLDAMPGERIDWAKFQNADKA